MINDKDKELIQAGVDGELDESGLEQLRRLLDESEEARHFHSELNRLAEFLDKIPDHELPDGLHARIVESTPLPKPSPLKSIFSFSEMPAMLRFGFAGAAALVLAVAVINSQDQFGDTGDVSNMVGTIARGGPTAGDNIIDSLALTSGNARADVVLGSKDGTLVLDLSLDSADAVNYQVDLGDSGLKVSGMAQPPGALELLENEQVLQGQSQGRQQFLVLLEATGQARSDDARIEVTVYLEGEEIQRGTLAIDG